MNINNDNKQAIHDVLIVDMQKRLYEQHNEIKVRNSFTIVTDEDYTSELETLVETILHTNSIADINDVVIEYGELFNEPMTVDTNIFTIEGTMNYIIALLVGEIHKIAYEFNDMLTK